MSSEQTSAKDDAILARRKDVWSRRVRGETVREIAEELGVGVATVHRDLEAVRAELDDCTKRGAEIERAIGANRLDGVARKLMAAVDQCAEASEFSTLANAIARIEERRAKLLGLDAATKTELTGADGGPVKVEDAKNALLAKLSSLAASETTEGEASGSDSAAES